MIERLHPCPDQCRRAAAGRRHAQWAAPVILLVGVFLGGLPVGAGGEPVAADDGLSPGQRLAAVVHKVKARNDWSWSVTVWDTARPQKPVEIPVPKETVNPGEPKVAVSRDGSRLVASVDGGQGGTGLAVLDVATGRPKASLKDLKLLEPCEALALAPDGRTLAVVAWRTEDKGQGEGEEKARKRVMVLLDLEAQKELAAADAGWMLPPFVLRFSEDGKLLAIGNRMAEEKSKTEVPRLSLYDTSSRAFAHGWWWSADWGQVAAMAISGDGRLLALRWVKPDKSSKLGYLNIPDKLWVHWEDVPDAGRPAVLAMDFCADESLMITRCGDGKAFREKHRGGRHMAATVRKVEAGKDWSWSVAVWDAANQREVRDIPVPKKTRNPGEPKVAIFGDGSELAVSVDSGRDGLGVSVVDIATGRSRTNLGDLDLVEPCEALALSPDGRTLAVVASREHEKAKGKGKEKERKRMLVFVDLETQKEQAAVDVNWALPPFVLRFSENGKLLAVGNRMFEAKSKTEVPRLNLYDTARKAFGNWWYWPADWGHLADVAFSRDGQLMAIRVRKPDKSSKLGFLYLPELQWLLYEDLPDAGQPEALAMDFCLDESLMLARCGDGKALLDRHRWVCCGAREIGVLPVTLTAAHAAYLKLDVKAGVYVLDVKPDSAAQKAGIAAGDVIVRANDRPVATKEDLEAVEKSLRYMAPVGMNVLRGGKTLSPTVHLQWKKEVPIDFGGVVWGLGSSPLTKFMQENYPDLPNPLGGFVQMVEVGSNADRAGIRPGDMIFEVDGKRAYSWQEVTAMEKTGGLFNLKLWRAGAGQPVALVCPMNYAKGNGKWTYMAPLGKHNAPRRWVVAADGSGDFQELYQAMMVVRSGDVVQLKPGCYGGSHVYRSGIRIEGIRKEGPRNVAEMVKVRNIVQWNPAAPLSDIVISGIVTGYERDGAGYKRIPANEFDMNIQNSSVLLRDCVINNAGTWWAKGVRFENCEIRGQIEVFKNSTGVSADRCTFLGGGPAKLGIELNADCTATITNSLFKGCGTGVVVTKAQGDIKNNTFAECGNGIRLLEMNSKMTLTIVNNIFFKCSARGIAWGEKSHTNSGDIAHNDFYKNSQAIEEARVSDTNCYDNPFFVDELKGDYRLQPGSPLLHKGLGGTHVGAFGPEAEKVGEGGFK